MNAARINSFPFKGWEGDGVLLRPIPTPSLPLKGRERSFVRLPCNPGAAISVLPGS